MTPTHQDEGSAISISPFYIAAGGLGFRPRRTIKHNDAFAVMDNYGDIGVVSGGPDGLFESDTRYLSLLEMKVDGMAPLLLGSAMQNDNLCMYVDLTNADRIVDDAVVLAKDSIHIAKTVILRNGKLHQRVAVRNHSTSEVRFSISIHFDSDFADIFEVRGQHRPRRGQVRRFRESSDKCLISYIGLDGKNRSTTIQFMPKPTTLGTNIASFDFVLAAGARQDLSVSINCAKSIFDQPRSFATELREAFVERRRDLRSAADVETSNAAINEVLSRARADFYMLITDTPEGPYPYAGIPWFSTTFGRDGIIAAMEMLWLDHRIARGVLRRLAAYQATSIDPTRDAEPGKILHEMRGGEMAELGEVPFGCYYGSADATPLFIILAGLYVERTGDDALLAELWPNIERALEWIDNYGDIDGDGFVEYKRGGERGLSNQGWKDSHDSVFHSDGRLADGPIALVEVQAYVFAAKIAAARCAQRLGKAELSSKLSASADKLRKRFDEEFWCSERQMYVLALDGKKRPCAVDSSNAGHALFAGISSKAQAKFVAQRLLHPEFDSGWGIRTLARNEARYNPMSYHNGSVWPHDNALIAAGLARYGLKDAIAKIFKGICHAASTMDHKRLPELFCGFPQKRGRGPILYPVACIPQAWACGAPFMMLQAMLGLEFDLDAREIRLSNPVVPSYLGEVIIKNLRLGDALVDFAVRGEGSAVALRVLQTRGSVKVTLVLDRDAHDTRQ